MSYGENFWGTVKADSSSVPKVVVTDNPNSTPSNLQGGSSVVPSTSQASYGQNYWESSLQSSKSNPQQTIKNTELHATLGAEKLQPTSNPTSYGKDFWTDLQVTGVNATKAPQYIPPTKKEIYTENLKSIFPDNGNILDKATNLIGRSVYEYLYGPIERADSIIQSIQQRSTRPLTDSFKQQVSELTPQEGDAPEQKLSKYTNLALMLTGEMETKAKPYLKNGKVYIPGQEAVAVNVYKQEPGAFPKALRQGETIPMTSQEKVGFKTQPLIENPQAGFVDPVAIASDVKAGVQVASEKVGETAKTFKTEFIDRYSPIQDLVKDKNISPEADPYIAARNYAGHMGKVENRLNDLSTVLTPAKDILPDVKEYALLERYQELHGRGIEKLPGGLTIDQVNAQKVALEAKLGPEGMARVQSTLDGIRAYNDKLLVEARDAGIISKESYDAIKKNNEKYIPLQRLEYLAEQGDNIPRGSNGFNVASQGIVKTIKGSEKAVADPIESMVRNTYNTVNLVERNKVAQKVADLSKVPEFKDTVIPLRTAEKVSERIGIYSDLKELKPVKNKLERLITTRNGWTRRIQSELNKLNKLGIKEYLKRGSEVLPRQQAQLIEKTRFKTAKTNTDSLVGNEVPYAIKPDWVKSDDANPGILDELKNAEAGKRIFNGYGSDLEVVGVKSTFPDWIPEDLRKSEIVKPVVKHLENGTIPTTKRQIELYNYIGDMIDVEQLTKEDPSGNSTFKKNVVPTVTENTTRKLVNTKITASDTKRLVESLIQEPPEKINAIKKKISTRNRYLSDVLDQLTSLRTKLDEVQSTRSTLRDSAKELADKPVPIGMEKLSVFRNGIKEEYAVPKEVGAALKGLNQQSADLITKWASKSSALLRAGATSLNAGFIPANAIRDLQTATLVSKVGFTPLDWLKGFSEAIKKGADYKAFLESGGASGFFEGQKSLPKTVAKLTEGKGVKILKTITNPVELLRTVGETIELAPRLGVFKRSLAKGLSETEAAFNARNATVDFAKAGNTMKVVNQWVPFLNARLQGNLNMLTAIKDRPISSALKLGAIVGVPVVSTYLHNLNSFPEIWNDISTADKRNYFIIIYGNNVDEKGNPTQVVKIPKGDAKIFANPLENFLNYLYKKDTKSLGRLALEIGSDVSPIDFERNGKFSANSVASSILPPAAKGLVEGVTNKNLYTGYDIVPQDMVDATPKNQYDKNTSLLAKELGKFLNWSPKKIDNFISTQFGGLGPQLTKPSTATESVTKRFVGARGGQQAQNMKDEAQQAVQEQADKKLELKRRADKLLTEFMSESPQQAAQDFDAIARNDKDLAKAIIDLKEKRDLGFNSVDYVIQDLGVENGERAKFLAGQFGKLKTNEEKAALWDDLVRKKLITAEVSRQMTVYLK